MMLKRRSMLAGLAASAGGAALANPVETSKRPVARPREFIAAPVLSPNAELAKAIADVGLSGEVACLVADARTGAFLEWHNPLLRLPPASVAKILTAFYALDRLGPEFRYGTRILATGPIVDGKIRGDIVLDGGGDPTLDGFDLDELASDLRGAGVTGLTGRFLVWDGWLRHFKRIDTEQPVYSAFNPGISGLNLNYNRVFFEWRRRTGGYQISMNAVGVSYNPDATTVSRMRVLNNQIPVFAYADGGAYDDWSVAEHILGRRGGRWLPVRYPGRYVGEVFAILAREKGIALPEPTLVDVRPEGRILARATSRDLAAVMAGMLKHSTNLTAEVVGMSATKADTGESPLTLSASAEEMNLWLKRYAGLRQPELVDHSGLGGASRLSPVDMVGALNAHGPSAAVGKLMRPSRVIGRNGRPIKGIEARTKTGTLNFVSTLSGWLTAPNGHDLAFAIFTADLKARDAIPIEYRDRPRGARSWSARSRRLQRSLLRRWAGLYASA